MNSVGIDDKTAQTIENVASYMPIIGTTMDIYSAIKHPSLENIGWVLADVAGNAAITKVAKAAKRSNRLAKNQRLLNSAHRINGEIIYKPRLKIKAHNQYPNAVKVSAWIASDPITNFTQNYTNK